MSIPWTYINAKLVAAGAVTAGISRRATARGCNRCHARVIVGFDAEVCALIATVDPTPLSAVGEVAAQLTGRRTYALSSDMGRLVLDDRTPSRIRHRPAGTGHFDTLPEHACGAGPLPEIPSALARRHAPLPAPNSPPPF